MPDIFGEVEDWFHRRHHHDQDAAPAPVVATYTTDPYAATPAVSPAVTTQTPAVRPVTVKPPAPKGTPMSLSTDMHALATRLEAIGEEAVTKLEAVSVNPATKEAFDVLHAITGLNVPPDVISLIAGGLKGIVAAYAPAPAPEQPQQPGGVAPQPVPAGQ